MPTQVSGGHHEPLCWLVDEFDTELLIEAGPLGRFGGGERIHGPADLSDQLADLDGGELGGLVVVAQFVEAAFGGGPFGGGAVDPLADRLGVGALLQGGAVAAQRQVALADHVVGLGDLVRVGLAVGEADELAQWSRLTGSTRSAVTQLIPPHLAVHRRVTTASPRRVARIK